MTRNSDSADLNKDYAANIGKIKVNGFEWYVSHTPSIPQQAAFFNWFLSKVPTELQYVERSVLMKEVNTQNLWSFELGTTRKYKYSGMDYYWFSTTG